MNVENEHYMRDIVKYYHIINGRDCLFFETQIANDTVLLSHGKIIQVNKCCQLDGDCTACIWALVGG